MLQDLLDVFSIRQQERTVMEQFAAVKESNVVTFKSLTCKDICFGEVSDPAVRSSGSVLHAEVQVEPVGELDLETHPDSVVPLLAGDEHSFSCTIGFTMELGKVHLNLKTLLLTMMMFKWGIFCNATANDCLSAPCQNAATCVDNMNDYACICAKDGVRYMGKHCEELYDACSFAPCGDCSSTPGETEYHCICPDGMAGDNCTEEVDECESNPCSEPQTLCVDQLNGYFCRCPEGFGGEDCRTHVTDCIDEPCRNNGTCLLRREGFECRCAPGFEGKTCEEDVNNGAICLDGEAEFHCFCVPGFQGYNCEIDINECASRPARTTAPASTRRTTTSVSAWGIRRYRVNCENEIDECESDPCHNGATCLDLISVYSCQCLPGFTGIDCEVDVDECDCSDTGFQGDFCELDIPECASDPCQHGATCSEGVREYTCLCWPGYEGPNCEVDIDECAEQPCENAGECFERSDPSHWDLDWDLSFADAAGYICQCQQGFAGENCSVNIDECESEPCQNGGTCEDQINGYTCTCAQGFLASLVKMEAGVKTAGPPTPVHCPDEEPGELPWGGDVCNVKLYGCVDHECQNGATCHPWLSEENHGHTCLCPHGFYDEQCSTRTTFSFSTLGLSSSRSIWRRGHEGKLNTRSIGVSGTTIPNMLLFYRGDVDNHLILEIVNGGLHAKAFSEESELDVRFPGLVSDGGWRDAHVFVDDGGLVLIVRGPGCDRDGCRVTDGGADEPPFQPSEAFSQIYIGGAPEELLEVSVSGAGFIGCMEDLMIDSKPILPQTLPEDQVHELGCSKTEWCKRTPAVETAAVWICGSAFNPDGLLFQLRKQSVGREEEGEVYFSVYLGMGRLFVSSLPNSAPLTAPIFVTTGENSSFRWRCSRNRPALWDRRDPRSDCEQWRSGLCGGFQLSGTLKDLRLDSVHLDVDAWNSSEDEEVYLPSDAENIKEGCNGGRCTITFNDFTCSCAEEYTGKTCETRVWCVSDPCVNGGHCVDLPDGYECKNLKFLFMNIHGTWLTWYSIQKEEGHATKHEQPVQFSAGGSLSDPVSNVYLELRSRSENAVILRASWGSDLLLVGLVDSSVRVEIHARNNVESLAFTGVRRVADGSWHRVNISMAEKRRKASPWIITVDGITDASSFPQRTGSIRFLNEKASTLAIAESFTGCLGAVRVGGVYLPFMDDYKAPQVSQFHSVGKPNIGLGCTSEPVCDSDPCVNGATCEDLFNKFGCVCDPGWEGDRCERDTDDCASQPCVHGSCRDHLAGFECRCHPGYAGTLCDEDLNECELHPCEHGGTCQDGPNMFTCTCSVRTMVSAVMDCGEQTAPSEIDECVSNPCRNGGSCLDRFNMFVCECPAGYSGPICDTNVIPWLMVALPLLCFCVLILVIGLTFMVLTARKKRQSEGAYSPSAQEVAGARLEMDSMLKVPPEERLI
ncbi:hypothetical protein F7725_015117 [Dissostichus mawsoni]|uniref:Uncharacterized protein n=1 Tax=Dissostichus mawsoni TaxID=36200 RepID=A0A7J5YGW6_DISMA|nr:hypothetical protein F7725_015117 [Dissostichus mawsoni]